VTTARVLVLSQSALLRMRNEHPALANRFDHMVITRLATSLARTNSLIATLG
jgi:hypothetical protein